MLYISNFVLDLNNIIMKKIRTMLILILAGTVTFTVGLWLYSTQAELTAFEYGVAGAVLIIVLFSLVLGVKRMKEAKKGYPVDDELSIQVKQKAAAHSFTFSFIIWTMILLFMGDMEVSHTIPIGIGIVSTGLLFLGLWAYYSHKGIGDGNTN